MIDVVGARLQKFSTPGSLGVVKDTRYIRCFWHGSDTPFSPFAEGSSGIEVEGPPTPRNILFPPGTKFLNGTRGDCFFAVTYEDQQVERPTGPEIKETVRIRGKDHVVTYREKEMVTERVARVREMTEAEARRG